MQAVTFCPTVQISFYAPIVARTRREIEGEAAKTPGWPVPWVIADRFTRIPASSEGLGLARLLVMNHDLTLPAAAGDVVEVLERARGASGSARLDLLLDAWRVHPAPAIATLATRLEAGLRATELKLPMKKKADQEQRWMELTASERPRSLFAAPWPTRWRDAQVRMRSLYVRKNTVAAGRGAPNRAVAPRIHGDAFDAGPVRGATPPRTRRSPSASCCGPRA
jgi:hypothetical protein